MNAMIKKIISVFPEWLKTLLKRTRDFVRITIYYGKTRLCPVCGKSSRKFRRFGLIPRDDAMCVHCGVLERHRFVWLYFKIMTDLFDGRPKKMLHVAPVESFEYRLKRCLGDNYITADLSKPSVMTKLNVTDIPFPDRSFDVIYCSHVLEHVQNDKKAIREFFRVLKESGWAILLVPITAEMTCEDSSIVEPHERLEVFGEEDHVRQYGPDYVDRLREVGFKVKISKVSDLFGKDEISYMGLTAASGDIFYCTK